MRLPETPKSVPTPAVREAIVARVPEPKPAIGPRREAVEARRAEPRLVSAAPSAAATALREAATAGVPEPRLGAAKAPAAAAPRVAEAKPAPRPEPPPVAPPAASKPRTGLGYAVAWALGIGVGAIAAGAFVGFLVNGPPRATLPQTIADVVPPTPAPPITPEEITRAGAPETAPSLKTDVASAAAPPARDALPPLRPPQAATTPPPAPTEPLAPADVRDIQGRLRALGFNPGPLDGAAGPQTIAAARQYQQARGLAATDTLDKDLLARLRQEPAPPRQAQAAAPPPRRTYAPPPPPPPPRRQQDPLLESIERLFRR